MTDKFAAAPPASPPLTARLTAARWALIALFLAWLFASVAGFYFIQKPLTPAFLAALAGVDWLPLGTGRAALGALGGAALDGLVATGIALAALGLGLTIWRRVGPPQAGRLDQTLFAWGLGFGALALLVLAAGLLGALQRPFLAAGTAALIGFTLRPTLSHLRALPRPRPGRATTFYLAIVTLLAATLALAPPTSWDGLFYHLTGPRLHLAAGAIRPGLDLPHLNFPSLMEMLFMLAMGLRGDAAARLLHLVFQLLLAGLVYAMARRHFAPARGWTAVLFLYATPMVITLGGWAYNDLTLAFYELLALHALLNWRAAAGRNLDDRARPWLLLCGVAAGLAMSLKYTSFIAPVSLGLWLLWSYRRHLKRVVGPALTFGLAALLVALPWYLKNWAFTGNPVYPFVFEGQYWNAFRAAAYADAGTGIGLDPLSLLALPASLTLGYDFFSGLQDASQDGLTGPLFLAFLPLMVWVAWRSRRERIGSTPGAATAVLWFALAHYLVWTLGVISSAGLWQSRLLLPALAALCPLLAWLLHDLGRFEHPQFSLRRFVTITLGLVLVLGLTGHVADWLPEQPWAYLTGAEGATANLDRRLGDHHEALTAVNSLVPADGVVVFLWEPRAYFCQRDCRPDSILDTLGNLHYLYGDAAAVAAAWRAEGVTHVLLWRQGLDFLLADRERLAYDDPRTDLTLLHALQDDYLTPLRDIGGYTLYALEKPS